MKKISIVISTIILTLIVSTGKNITGSMMDMFDIKGTKEN